MKNRTGLPWVASVDIMNFHTNPTTIQLMITSMNNNKNPNLAADSAYSVLSSPCYCSHSFHRTLLSLTCFHNHLPCYSIPETYSCMHELISTSHAQQEIVAYHPDRITVGHMLT